jgi:hypothetical protein
MKEEYWLKCGFEENGELVCVRMISNSKPDKSFFYTVQGGYKEVKNPVVLKLTPEIIYDMSKNG